MKYLKLLTGGFARLLITALSGDILYLYYSKAWYDPIILIEYTEVVLLWMCVVIGIVWTAYYLNKHVGKENSYLNLKREVR